MIDWWGVASNAIWILGLAVLLATASYRSWAGRTPSASGRSAGRIDSAAFYNLGLLLFAGGMLATSDAWWERAGWVVVLLLIIGPGLLGRVERRKVQSPGGDGTSL